jgi:hypothetical protein
MKKSPHTYGTENLGHFNIFSYKVKMILPVVTREGIEKGRDPVLLSPVPEAKLV